jgi:hypothetical protein
LAKLWAARAALAESPVSAPESVKGADVVWLAPERVGLAEENSLDARAPELCVGVMSPANPARQSRSKVAAYFASGALADLGPASLFVLEPARKKLTPNQMTVLSGLVLAASYALMAMVRHPQVFFTVAALAGVAWTVSASELWVAGQRVIPDWISETVARHPRTRLDDPGT